VITYLFKALNDNNGKGEMAVVMVEDYDQQRLALLRIVRDFPGQTRPATINFSSVSITFRVDILYNY
jgi:hypothetical protein